MKWCPEGYGTSSKTVDFNWLGLDGRVRREKLCVLGEADKAGMTHCVGGRLREAGAQRTEEQGMQGHG